MDTTPNTRLIAALEAELAHNEETPDIATTSNFAILRRTESQPDIEHTVSDFGDYIDQTRQSSKEKPAENTFLKTILSSLNDPLSCAREWLDVLSNDIQSLQDITCKNIEAVPCFQKGGSAENSLQRIREKLANCIQEIEAAHEINCQLMSKYNNEANILASNEQIQSEIPLLSWENSERYGFNSTPGTPNYETEEETDIDIDMSLNYTPLHEKGLRTGNNTTVFQRTPITPTRRIIRFSVHKSGAHFKSPIQSRIRASKVPLSRKLEMVLQAIKAQGFFSLKDFLVKFLSLSATHLESNQVENMLFEKQIFSAQKSFFQKDAFVSVVKAILSKCNTNQIKKIISLTDAYYVSEIDELVKAAKDLELKVSATKVTKSMILSVSKGGIPDVFSERAPMLLNLISQIVKRDLQSKNFGYLNTLIISQLLFARNNRVNLLQAAMGYYCYAVKVPRRTIRFLNRIGLSISYDNIIRGLRETAEEQGKEIRLFCQETRQNHISWVPVYDNTQHNSKKAQQSIDNKDSFIVATSRAILRLDQDYDFSNIEDPPLFAPKATLSISDLLGSKSLPSNHWRTVFISQAFDALLPFSKSLQELLELDPTRRPKVASIRKIPYGKGISKPELIPIPTVPIDESSISGNIEVLHSFFKEYLQLPSNFFLNRTIPVFGDLSTIKKIISIINLRNENNLDEGVDDDSVYESFRFLFPVTQLLHTRLAACRMIFANHWGSSNLESVALQAYSNRFNMKRVDSSVKNFHECERLLFIASKAHIVDAVLETLNCPSTLDLENHVAFSNWDTVYKILEETVSRHYDLRDIVWKRENSDLKDRDIVHENGRLFSKHAAYYLEYMSALRDGDIGRVMEVLKVWTVQFQASSKTSQYGSEYLRIMQILEHESSALFRTMIENNLISNPTGQLGKFREIDEMQEFFNFLEKIVHGGERAQDLDFLCRIVSQNIPFFGELLSTFETSVSDKRNWEHKTHSVVKMESSIRQLVDNYFRIQQIAKFIPFRNSRSFVSHRDRQSKSNDLTDCKEHLDLMHEGMGNFKANMKKMMGKRDLNEFTEPEYTTDEDENNFPFQTGLDSLFDDILHSFQDNEENDIDNIDVFSLLQSEIE